MKRLAFAMLFTSLAFSPLALAQTDKQPAKKDAPAVKVERNAKEQPKSTNPAAEAWAKAGEVGPMHKLIAQYEGEWTTEAREFGTDGTPSSADKGKMSCKMVLGGRFLHSELDGRYKGQFFKGSGLMGYNNVDKRVESTWAESTGTGISMMTGQFDAAGKVLTLTGEYTDPVSGKKTTIKEVTTWTGPDAYKSEFFDEKGTKTMEISYTKGTGAKELKKEAKTEAKEEKAEKKAEKK